MLKFVLLYWKIHTFIIKIGHLLHNVNAFILFSYLTETNKKYYVY